MSWKKRICFALAMVASAAATFFVLEITFHPDHLNGQSQSSNEQLTAVDANQPKTAQPQLDPDLYDKVRRSIKERYVVAPVDEQKLDYGAIAGTVRALNDPYSVFLDPSETKLFHDDDDGVFGGIGAELKLECEGLTVEDVLPGKPAEKTGVRRGDIVLKIDETVTDGLTLREAILRIRGQVGQPVKLTVKRAGRPEPLVITVIRAEIIQPFVESKLVRQGGRTVAVIALHNFDFGAAPAFAQAVKEALGAKAIAVILDLRDNPGGNVFVSGIIAGTWLKKQVFVQEKTRDKLEPDEAGGKGELQGMPTVVLINHGSASAAEILAIALQDYGLARLIGEKTYGKGCGQSVIDYPDGSELRLTTFFWLSPKGRSIDKVGITPDETVPLTQEDRDQGRDPQLDRALELLTSGK